jgi:hypothetical protein
MWEQPAGDQELRDNPRFEEVEEELEEGEVEVILPGKELYGERSGRPK